MSARWQDSEPGQGSPYSVDQRLSPHRKSCPCLTETYRLSFSLLIRKRVTKFAGVEVAQASGRRHSPLSEIQGAQLGIHSPALTLPLVLRPGPYTSNLHLPRSPHPHLLSDSKGMPATALPVSLPKEPRPVSSLPSQNSVCWLLNLLPRRLNFQSEFTLYCQRPCRRNNKQL